MPEYHFNLNLSSDQYLDYYRGVARDVMVRSLEGPSIQFPASRLQPFITRNGVHGFFKLICDDNQKFRKLVQLAAGSEGEES